MSKAVQLIQWAPARSTFMPEPTILRVSLIMRLARPTRIRFAGQRLPYHQNAQTRRVRGDRGKWRTNHGQPSRAVLGPWETTRAPRGSGVGFRVKRTTCARSELFRF